MPDPRLNPMTLHPNWRNILRYAWSVRFNGLGLLLSGAVVFLQMVQPYSHYPPFLFAIGTFLCFVGAGISRLIAQDKFRGDDGKP